MTYGKLVAGGYVITESHASNALYVDDYKKLKAGMIKKYGLRSF